MNKDFLSQLHRNLGVLEEHMFHAKDKNRVDVIKTISVIEKMVNSLPKSNYQVDSKFHQIEDVIKIMVPMRYHYFFVLFEGFADTDMMMLGSNLNEQDTLTLIQRLASLPKLS